jgi:ABC-type nitrate/sulfonate/bicarbonate transport system permease component
MASNAAGRPPSALESLLKDRGLQVLSLLALLGIWALFSLLIGTFGGHSIVPGPLDTAPELAKLLAGGKFVTPLLETLSRTAVGFVTAFVAGLSIGLATAKLPTFKAITAQSMNVLLFAPTLVLIYLGTSMIGVGYVTVAIIAGLVVAPNVSIYMRDVMADFDQELADMADSYRATTRQRIFDVYIPYLVPPILAASRICFSQSWKVVMLMEVFGMPGGLGYQIRSSYYVFDLPRMMAYLVVFIVALLLIEQLIRFVEHRIVKWQ